MDTQQLRAMNEDHCLLVDWNDLPIGHASKLVSHRSFGLLHRAFSVFIFDNNNRLLLQQRSTQKITFPDHWTNSCCSHPLNSIPEPSMFDPHTSPVEHAIEFARLRVHYELGIPLEQIPANLFRFAARIHYFAASGDRAVGGTPDWSEHELDYMFLVRAREPLALAPNANEVRDVRYVSPSELDLLVRVPGVRLSPWFSLLFEQRTLLNEWWRDQTAAAGPAPAAQPGCLGARAATAHNGGIVRFVRASDVPGIAHLPPPSTHESGAEELLASWSSDRLRQRLAPLAHSLGIHLFDCC